MLFRCAATSIHENSRIIEARDTRGIFIGPFPFNTRQYLTLAALIPIPSSQGIRHLIPFIVPVITPHMIGSSVPKQSQCEVRKPFAACSSLVKSVDDPCTSQIKARTVLFVKSIPRTIVLHRGIKLLVVRLILEGFLVQLAYSLQQRPHDAPIRNDAKVCLCQLLAQLSR
ncbi:hypothetical protein SDC9_108581 [bioreactor metagenome]|uniref:Uncharacterized protein n=1 Tax=bioreactor metagenome TaxID=1076179 RepID=A0A645BAP9_9ZZZZ